MLSQVALAVLGYGEDPVEASRFELSEGHGPSLPVLVVDVEVMGAGDRRCDELRAAQEGQGYGAVLEPVVVENRMLEAFVLDEAPERAGLEQVDGEEVQIEAPIRKVGSPPRA